MKNIILTSLLLMTIAVSYSQEEEKSSKPILERKHELKIGTIKLLAGPIFEGTYEYIQDSNTGFGASVLFNLNSENDYFEDYSLTPFYRMYFQSNEDYGAKGFFVEGFTTFFGGREFIDYYEDIDGDGFDDFRQDNDKFFDIAIGISLGKKWINTRGFVFETRIGVGRNLLGNSEIGLIVKGDLYVGYRF